MMNNTMNTNNNAVANNNREYLVFALVNKNGVALLLNGKTNKYITLTDEQGSSTMASAQLLANFVSKLERDTNKLVKIIYPKNLCGSLKIDSADKWIANNYTTEQGTQLTQNYCELIKYINDMRTYLGTSNLITVSPTGGLVNASDKQVVDKAWKALFNITNAKPAKQYARKPEGQKPALPSFVKVDESVEF